MDIDMTKLRMLYGSLIGMREALALASELFYKTLGDDYSATVQDLAILLSQDLSRFQLPEKIYDKYGYESLLRAKKGFLEGKLIPLISFLEYGYHLNEEVAEVGTLYSQVQNVGVNSPFGTSRTSTDDVFHKWYSGISSSTGRRFQYLGGYKCRGSF